MSKSHTPISYVDYLQINSLLQLQKKRSAELGTDAHDEMLFIIIHQVYELWFKQILTEIDSVLGIFGHETIDERELGTVIARLSRVTEIQKVLIDQVRVLETMTPLDFLDFREFIFPASGFQSVQFRLVENKLGLKRDNRVAFNAVPYTAYVEKTDQPRLETSEAEPSLFDRVEKWLERTPFLQSGGFTFWNLYRQAVARMFARDRKIIEQNPLLSDGDRQRNLQELDATLDGFHAIFDEQRYNQLRAEGSWRLSYRALHAALLIHLYRDQPILQLPFRVLVALQDIDELFTTWRYRHALMAHRMLGAKIGTGGSSGHRYLKSTTDKHRIYNDFFNLATFLIPRSELPELPKDIQEKLGFYYR